MIQESFIKLYEKSFRENWELKAYADYDTDTLLTYGDVARKIARLHLFFGKIGIKRGDKIALVGKNSSHWAVIYLATVTYGAVIVPILAEFNPNDMHHIVNHSDSVLLFASGKIWESLEEEKMPAIKGALSVEDFTCLYQKIAIKSIIKDLDTDFAAKYPDGFRREDVSYPEILNTEVASINYTSGTTGFSKGVVTPHNALAGNVTFGIFTKLLVRHSRVLCFLPMAHAYGCAFDFLTATAVGSEVTFLGKTPAPKILLKAFAEVKPTMIFSVPLILEKVYKSQILPTINSRSMKMALSIPLLNEKIYGEIRKKLVNAMGGEFFQIIVGGAPMSKEVEEFLLKIKFPFTIGYGMTECAPLISYTPHTEFKPSSAGKILDIMEVKILSNNPYEEVGEICVRGENVMLGYYKNDEATAEVIDADGWLHTGDLGTIDADGTIFIRGRSKSMILSSNGQNIYPEEIEAKLNNMPFVMESLVVEKGGKLVALVYPDYESIDEARIHQSDIQSLMEENLKNLNKSVAVYENVSSIRLYPNEFEKTPKRSIKRYLYSQIV
ncbi:MAG: AMP-binding protein [Prevotellaceae bacterium]|nr:AMP-binding protein [Prevotellaceae bacterium]